MKPYLIFFAPNSLLHKTNPFHPESTHRYSVVKQALEERGLLNPQTGRRAVMPSRKWLFLAHTRAYVRLVQETCKKLKEEQIALLPTGDTEVSKGSYDAALQAAGATMQAVDAVMKNECLRAFVLARPPGHHATSSKGMGFCIFNTVALAAFYAKKKWKLQRIVIIDLDAHHGNGTEELVSMDPNIFYFSTHEKGLYPKTGGRDFHGVGNIMNRPVLGGKRSRKQLLAYYEHDLTKALQTFQPELILVSCGFDPHKNDPISHIELETEDFSTLSRLFVSLADRYCKGRLVSVLEGGYNLQALQDASCAYVQELSSPIL